MDLDHLSRLHVNHCNTADGYATSTHSGVAAVLQEVADDARRLAARTPEVYDNRLLYQFAAKLDKIARPTP
jgi:hypothetical protein